MTVTVALLALWATLAVARKTPIGRFLHRAMVERPATALSRITRGHVLLAMILIGLGGSIAWFGGADGVLMLGMAAPDAAAWLVTFEVSMYLDVLAAFVAASSAMRFKGARDRLAAAVAPLVRRSTGDARPRCSRRRGATKAANDDEDGAGLALAS